MLNMISPTILFGYQFRATPVRYNADMLPLAADAALVTGLKDPDLVHVVSGSVPKIIEYSIAEQGFCRTYFPDFAAPVHKTAMTIRAMRLFSHINPTTLTYVTELAKAGLKLPRLKGDGRCWFTHTHRNCVVTEWADDKVTYIALDGRGFRMQTIPEVKFLEYYKPASFDSREAAKVYQFYLTHYPTADQRIIKGLAALSTGKVESIMARKAAVVEEIEDEDELETIEEQELPKTKRGRGATAAKGKAAPAERKPRAETAASMFQALIMEGNLTDAQIFAKVQKKYNLDDNKSGYVKWYRNYLAKRGQNPPEAKGGK
jgi:hypothetical protein